MCAREIGKIECEEGKENELNMKGKMVNGSMVWGAQRLSEANPSLF